LEVLHPLLVAVPVQLKLVLGVGVAAAAACPVAWLPEVPVPVARGRCRRGFRRVEVVSDEKTRTKFKLCRSACYLR